jgi:hypothetical protein
VPPSSLRTRRSRRGSGVVAPSLVRTRRAPRAAPTESLWPQRSNARPSPLTEASGPVREPPGARSGSGWRPAGGAALPPITVYHVGDDHFVAINRVSVAARRVWRRSTPRSRTSPCRDLNGAAPASAGAGAEWRRRESHPRPRNTFPMLATSVPAESNLGVRVGTSAGHVPGAIPS